MNVRETVQDALQKQGVPLSPQYQQYADVVIGALENREADIVANIMLAAREQGLNLDIVERTLADCGLEYRAAAAEAEDPRIAAMERQIEEMQASLRELRG